MSAEANDAPRQTARRLPEQPNFHADKASVYAAGFRRIGIQAVAAAAAQMKKTAHGESDARALPSFMLDADAA